MRVSQCLGCRLAAPAMKCGKTGFGIRADTIRECSLLLERELLLFPAAKALRLVA